MSQISPSEDSSVTDLKLNSRDILAHLQAGNLAKFLVPAELDIDSGRTRPVRKFLKEFKRDNIT